MPKEGESNQYSREAYEEAEEKIEEAKDRINPEASTDDLRQAVEDRGRAEEDKGHLHESAQDEALELNKQYDELYAKKDQIAQEIADFRREKLGMEEPKEAMEAEKKEPTLEEWAGVYAEMSGKDPAKILETFKSFQAKMSETHRQKLTLPIYGREGLSTNDVWEEVKAENPTYEYINPAKITTEGETGKAFVAFARFSQEPDEDSLGEKAQTALDWEKTGRQFMSPKQAMVAREAYRRLTGKQMDEKNQTMCPGSRSGFGSVPRLYFSPGDRGVYLNDCNPGDRVSFLGVRRVVSRELES